MSYPSANSKGSYLLLFLFFISGLFVATSSVAQMRQVYVDNQDENNEIEDISFYSPTSGYVAFNNHVGFTTDSGYSFIKKNVTIGNVNFGSYSVNLTFGFVINGVQAFDANTLLLFGHYGLVPSILRSVDGGNTFTLVYHSQFNINQLSGGITDMSFATGSNIGFAVDFDRVLKTTNQGQSWTVAKIETGADFSFIQAIDDNSVFAASYNFNDSKLLKSTSGGSSWTTSNLPAISGVKLLGATFLTATNGWVSVFNPNDRYSIYTTINGGTSWILQNDPEATPFGSSKMVFTDINTGYAVSGLFTLFKTTDGGKIWEPLPRNNAFEHLNYSHNALQCFGTSQLWAGGGHGFLEMSTNGGGTPLPRAFFKSDTTGLAVTGTVQLLNYSKTGYTHRWYLNGNLISQSYNASYQRDINRIKDTIQLVVSNGTESDTATKYNYFHPPVIISSFTPITGGSGTVVTITGNNFTNITSVFFGGVAAASYTVVSPTTIRATVATGGASGMVTVGAIRGAASMAGFTFVPLPVISSFTPMSAIAGTNIVITGNNFIGVSSVRFGGINATFTVVSPTLINAVAPSGQSGSLTVTTPGGTSTLTGYIALPNINSFTPDNGTQGTILNISGTSLTGVTSVTVGGIAVQSFTVISANSIRAIVGAGASGVVSVTKPGGSASLSGFSWFNPPVITSFAPTSGPIGTSVIITGTGFNASAAANAVYFGEVKALISQASSSSLTVIVPAGASFESIRVINNNLTGFSSYPFLVTFSAGGSITSGSFSPTEINTGANIVPTDIRLSDFDGDGKVDLALQHSSNPSNTNGVSIYRNTSTGNNVTFANPVTLLGGFEGMAIGDLDGDGKTDVMMSNGTTIITSYRNVSTPGNISFITGPSFVVNNSVKQISIADIDGDGKADMVTGSGSVPTTGIVVSRNTGEPGNISFAAGIIVSPLTTERNIVLSDIDGDTKPEIIITGKILKNNSTKGNISFASPITIPGYIHSYQASGDIDGDGKTDIIIADHEGSAVGVLRNSGTGGNISFDPITLLPATAHPSGIAVTDLDGDGRLDIGIGLGNHAFAAFKNISVPGTVSFATKIDYTPSSFSEHMLAFGDINNDGKNDVVVLIAHTISVYKNSVSPEPFVQSFTPTISIAGSVVNITGNNFTGVTAVSFGGVAAASFTVNSPTSITAVVSAGNTGAVAVTNNFGTGLLSGFIFGAPPVITSFSPLSAPVGASVVIAGSNFSPLAADNIVYFGEVRAVVTASSANSITATVPAGSTHQPLTVTVDGLTTYSQKFFNVSFPGSAGSFSAGSFAPRFERPGSFSRGLSDIDGDGKIDLVGKTSSGSFTVSRNTSNSGALSFASAFVFPVTIDGNPFAYGDINGDGKRDIISINSDGNSVSVYLNNSSAGNISIASGIRVALGTNVFNTSDIIIRDVDADGKSDIIVSNYSTRTLSILQNQSTSGNINFAQRLDYHVDGYATNITVGDLDGDNLPELIAAVNSNSVVSVFRNKSIPGTPSFENKKDFPTGEWPTSIETGDFDGDGKTDIVFVSLSRDISILRNLSVAGSIAFAVKQDFSVAEPQSLSVGDLDGDGKPEIVTHMLGGTANQLSVLRNNSSPGSISMQSPASYSLANQSGGLWCWVADMDGDGISDIVVAGSQGVTSIFRNLTGASVTVPVCPNASKTITSNITGSTYQWEQNTGTGFIALADNTNITGSNTVSLQLSGIPLSWNGYQYRCIVNGTQISSNFSLVVSGTPVTPSVSITTPLTEICAGASAVFTATPVNQGAAPVYQWQVNGVNVGGNTPSYNATGLTNAAQVKVLMTSNAVCASPAMVTSNTIAMTVRATVTPAVTITVTPQLLCAGTTASFTANPVNGGDSPSFQWQKNSQTVGTNSVSYTDNNLTSGDLIRVTLTSNANCASVFSVVSDAIPINITPSVTPQIIIAGNNTVVQGETTVINSSVNEAGLNPSYLWQDSTSLQSWQAIVSGTSQSINYQPVKTGDKLRCYLIASSSCANPAAIYSNVIEFIVQSGRASSGIVTPNPVGSTLYIDSLSIVDNWQSLEIISMGGLQKLRMNADISNRRRVSVDVANLTPGLYIVVLRSRDRSPLYLKFIKM